MSDSAPSMASDSRYVQSGGTKLRVMHPSDSIAFFDYMNATGAIQVELANFGRFQTGTSIQGRLFYPFYNEDACMELEDIDHWNDEVWHGLVIVDGGGCTWETKARNVQRAGAHALIIADDQYDEIEGREDHLSPMSRYDGSGTSIHIPTMIISEEDGDNLIMLIEGTPDNDEGVIVKADIEISYRNSQSISYSLFYGSILDLEPNLILRLYEYQHALMDKAIFLPRIMTFACEGCPNEIKEQHCVSKGAFCFTPPSEEKANMYPDMTDRQLIEENIRERCIYAEIGEWEDEWDDHIFFNYLYNILFSCLPDEKQITKRCAEKQMEDLGIDVKKVNSCMQESFDVDGDYSTYNEMLYDDREVTNDLGIQLNPSLTINSQIYNGDMKGEPIFRSICQAYRHDMMPEVCEPNFDIQLALGHIEDFQPPQFGHWHLIGVIFMVALCNIGLIIYCLKRRKRDDEDAIQSQVQMQVERYFKLANDDNQF